MKKLSINTFKYKRNKYITEIQSIDLLQRLQQLLSHGFTLYQSFKFLNSYFKYKERTINKKIIQHLQNGATCYDILKIIGYPELVLLQIKFAENYGNIEEALVDTVQYMKRNLKAKKRLIKTLQYPAALISIFLFILTILNITVIPQFQQLYETMNVKLSTFQNLLTLIITRLPKLTFIFIFISGIAFFITYKFYYYLPIEKKLKSILKIPMINTYYKIYRTYQLSNQLSLFYRNGTSLQQIVHIYRNEQDNDFLKFLGDYLFKEANKGLPLPVILMNLKCFQNDLIKFIEQGEKNGKLDIELKLYSQMLLQQFEEKVLKQTKFIQPIIFFILGFFIVSLYLVIMLPMFELMQTIK